MLKRLLFPFTVFLVATAILYYSPQVSDSFRPKPYNPQHLVRAEVVKVLLDEVRPDNAVPSIVYRSPAASGDNS